MDLSTILLVVAFLVDFAIRVIAIIVVPRNRRPTSGMAWLLAIFLIPYLGFLLFLLIGYRTLPKRRVEMQAEINQFILDSTAGMERVQRDHPWPGWLESVVALNRNLGAMPLVGDNRARLHGNYEETFAAMVADIDKARKYVHVEFYILSLDPTTTPFFDALENAVKRGVTVRVLMDHIQSMRKPGFKQTKKRLTESGVQWQLMLPLQPFKGQWQRPDLRNHRKLVIVDGRVGFMGSQNVIDRTYNMKSNIRRGLKWKDLMVRLEGPIVSGLNAIFITDWYSETNELLTRDIEPVHPEDISDAIDCQVVPSGPGFEGENNLRLFLALLYYAQERIVITSPYFVPDESIMYAITTAVQRGLHVELFVSEIGDQALVYHAQRSYYEELLQAGVKIYMYKAPYVLHAKHFTIDDDVAVIGSSNMDMRSFSLNFEVSLMVRGASFVQALRAVEDGYRADSRELTLEEWMKQPLRSTILDNLARLTSAVQ
ncbi:MULTISPECIES: cardiolipin synthase [Cryobacterium]|uniref:cardiolipin synthase n=1 Tax=Cryobacterium TaxID=69578 RepID=UPI000B4DD5BB|nr:MULTISPECIES: cardiolipin synthase [unclassified Cryobacterium]POH66791.1 cardiolipin synthase [Cryobacterium zongtaii]TFC42458.1 cardiolipin synthase [Cryobacterium sp. TMN-39-2]TFC60295.1 cardiolipin synthase [Cryobacterium sp. TMB1-7]TFC92925.1 cardiolipin synthase [Cryobacterium sp. TMT4-31]ASD24106.1 cardiolipin synthase [Cryobacterium sp. LW097]